MLVATTVLALWMAGKVFRIGLMGYSSTEENVAKILDALRNTGVEVLEQRQRIGRIASYETSCPFLQPFGWIRILRDGQCTKVSPFVIGVAEWV